MHSMPGRQVSVNYALLLISFSLQEKRKRNRNAFRATLNAGDIEGKKTQTAFAKCLRRDPRLTTAVIHGGSANFLFELHVFQQRTHIHSGYSLERKTFSYGTCIMEDATVEKVKHFSGSLLALPPVVQASRNGWLQEMSGLDNRLG